MAILENLFAKNFKMTKPRKFCTSKISQYTVFAIECKIVKTAEVFPLESFAAYGIQN